MIATSAAIAPLPAMPMSIVFVFQAAVAIAAEHARRGGRAA